MSCDASFFIVIIDSQHREIITFPSIPEIEKTNRLILKEFQEEKGSTVWHPPLSRSREYS